MATCGRALLARAMQVILGPSQPLATTARPLVATPPGAYPLSVASPRLRDTPAAQFPPKEHHEPESDRAATGARRCAGCRVGGQLHRWQARSPGVPGDCRRDPGPRELLRGHGLSAAQGRAAFAETACRLRR